MTISKNDPKLLAYRAERDTKKRRRMADQLIRENDALIVKLVTKFSRWAPDGIEFDDLMQAGYIAFLYTIDNIDTTKTFSTYYAYRVWYEVSKCCEKAGLIYKPRGSGIPFKVLRAMEEFETRNGRKPTAAELGLADEKMERWATLPTVSSLDVEVQDGASLHEALPDNAPNPEEQAIQDERWEFVRLCLDNMTDEDLAADDLSVDEVAEARRALR